METNSLGGLSQDQFMTLLLAGLKNQDPFQPVNGQEFIAQLSQFATLQGMQNLNAGFAEQLKLQQLTNGSALIGRHVLYLNNGAESVGRVDALTVENGKILLNIGDTRIGLDAVRSVGS